MNAAAVPLATTSWTSKSSEIRHRVARRISKLSIPVTPAAEDLRKKRLLRPALVLILPCLAQLLRRLANSALKPDQLAPDAGRKFACSLRDPQSLCLGR